MNNKSYPFFLGETLFGKGVLARDIIVIIAASLVMAALAQIRIPLWPVPVTAQTLGVVLAGALLGSKRGAAAMAAYIVQGAAGLPFFAGGNYGITALFGPTGGYLLGFVAAAYVVGLLTERGWNGSFTKIIAAMLAGHLTVLVFGVAWLSYYDFSTALSVGFFPFLYGMAIKSVMAGSLVHAILRKK